MPDLVARSRRSPARRQATARSPLRRLPAAVAVALAVVSGLAVPGVAWADQGLDTFCWQPNYGCTSGGYAGQPPWNWLNKQWVSAGDPGYWSGASIGNGGHHNCTLYAAYREALNGVPDPGNLGNAAGWASHGRE